MYNLHKDFNTQIILGCDDNGNFLEYIPRSLAHTGDGKRHIAISVLILNSNGEVLLQKRKHKIFDNIWDFTASTHPVKTENGHESLEECTLRCLKDEYAIEDEIVLKNLGGFIYFEKYGNFCENEFDYLLVGEYNGDFSLNPDAGYSCKWMEKEAFIKDVKENPKEYAPWVIAGLEVLEKNF